MATSALYLAKRDQSHYTSLGQQSAWTDTKLSGFRLTASAGDRGRYWKSIELGAAPKKGQDPSEATASAVVQVGPAASGLEEAFDVRLAGDAEGLFTDVVASEDAPLTTSPHAVTVNAHLAEHLARVDIISSPPSALTSGALPAGETLHVFNTAEQYAGVVEVKVPSWMSKVGTAGKAAGAQSGAGGAKAPMRASPSVLSSTALCAHADAGSLHWHSLEDRAGLCHGGPRSRRRRPARRRRGDEDRVLLSFLPFLANRRPPAHLLLCMQEHVLRAAKSGKVEKVTVKEGDLVPEGKVLVAFVEEAPEEGADSPKA